MDVARFHYWDASAEERAEAERLCALANAHLRTAMAAEGEPVASDDDLHPYQTCEVAVDRASIPNHKWFSVRQHGAFGWGGWIRKSEDTPGFVLVEDLTEAGEI